jgi:hypothetical protein
MRELRLRKRASFGDVIFPLSELAIETVVSITVLVDERGRAP